MLGLKFIHVYGKRGPVMYSVSQESHDDVVKWIHFPRYWPFVRGIHRWPVNSPHKGQWRGALMFSLISVWINDWVNNREAGDLRRHRGHYGVTVMMHTVCVCCVSFDFTHTLQGEFNRVINPVPGKKSWRVWKNKQHLPRTYNSAK